MKTFKTNAIFVIIHAKQIVPQIDGEFGTWVIVFMFDDKRFIIRLNIISLHFTKTMIKL